MNNKLYLILDRLDGDRLVFIGPSVHEAVERLSKYLEDDVLRFEDLGHGKWVLEYDVYRFRIEEYPLIDTKLYPL